MLENLTDLQVREAAKARIEALERWLRRIVDQKLGDISASYESYSDEAGNFLIRKDIRDKASSRREKNPDRFPRFIDAVDLDELITVVCKQWDLFSDPLSKAFPEGREEARTFLERIIGPRNKLAHANALSLREAEQAICYSGDVVDSLKEYYRNMGNQKDFNVPTIVQFSDSFGNVIYREQMIAVAPLGVMVDLKDNPRCYLHPGDILTFQIEVDPSFEPSDYSVSWTSFGPPILGSTTAPKLVIPITLAHVGEQLDFRCTVTSKKEWHRSTSGFDDMFDAKYRVLPPVS